MLPALSALAAIGHHLAAFLVVACLLAERLLVTEPLTPGLARKIVAVDITYGLASLALILIGASRTPLLEKGAHYYFHNAFFIAKIALYTLVGLISILPTRTYINWRKTLAKGRTPLFSAERRAKVVFCISLELAGMVGVLACAALMAKGWGGF
jgi:putative membrane protein